MSTKKYRIYKAGGAQQGRVMNPTAMWFAQMGAQQPSEEEMMMMQQSQGQAPMQGMPPQQPSQEEMAMMQQAQQQGPSEEDLMEIMQVLQETIESGENLQEVVAQLLQSQVPPEIIIQSLIQIGAPQQDAEALVMTTIEQMQAAQGEQQSQPQGQPQMSEEEMMMMQQEQLAAEASNSDQQALAMGKNGYIKKKLKEAKAGMSMDEESAVGSATNFAANTQPIKNALLNYNDENKVKNTAGNKFDNMQMQMQSDELEQARFGRARRQDRRNDRRDARQDRELDRTIRNAYGNIAFPAGVAPMMMPGAPMMAGTPSIMDMEIHRGGLFNRIKEVKMHMENTGGMNMPINFAQGMFMNGLYNPRSMQKSGNFMYDITYPGTRETPNSGGGNTSNDNVIIKTDPTDNTGNNNTSNNNTSDNDATTPTTNTEPESGCGEGMKWNANVVGDNGLAGACVENIKETVDTCIEGMKWDPNLKDCICKDSTKAFDPAIGKCVTQGIKTRPPESGGGLSFLIPPALTMGLLYYNREKIAKWIVDRGDKVTKNTIEQAIKEITDKNLAGYLSDTAEEGMERIGRNANGQYFMDFEGVKTLPGPDDIRLQNGLNMVDDVIPPVNRPSGTMFDTPKLKVPKSLTGAERKAILNTYRTGNLTQLKELARLNNIKIPNPTGISKDYLKTLIKKGIRWMKQEGGEIDSMDLMYGDPDLYRFTGGGQGVDYFGEGGYYNDIETNDFTIMSEPAYKNVYDPYMNNDVEDELFQYTYGGNYQEGQELYMPADQIAQFMAAGGVIEFLD
jgi:hypothetical protein